MTQVGFRFEGSSASRRRRRAAFQCRRIDSDMLKDMRVCCTSGAHVVLLRLQRALRGGGAHEGLLALGARPG